MNTPSHHLPPITCHISVDQVPVAPPDDLPEGNPCRVEGEISGREAWSLAEKRHASASPSPLISYKQYSGSKPCRQAASNGVGGVLASAAGTTKYASHDPSATHPFAPALVSTRHQV